MHQSELERFEAAVLPHLNGAYSLARYLTRNDFDAEDVVQDACLRALRYFGGFRGTTAADGRAWLYTIVRNTAHTWRHRNRADTLTAEFDEAVHSEHVGDEHPESALDRSVARESLAESLDRLPPEFREVLVLRELEGLSYKEISAVVGAPVGTVMSRLSRARKRLQEELR
ncbi:MAG TPA: sigma-70 family RNA polymerase sigma factor [Gemmatimonadales bacterium]|nr:sigma-70 family RNA polymerase sigma factor [Gemmatimonadales bacterium]